MLFILRWKYQRDVSPSKSHPHGRILAEFLPEAGSRHRVLVDVMANGIEIKAPAGHKQPRYFFDKSAMGIAKYPTQPLLPLAWIQIDTPIVSWYKDCPEPIPAALSAYTDKDKADKIKSSTGKKTGIVFMRPKTIATAEMLDLVRDTDSLALAGAVNEEMAKTQEELAKALSSRLDKRYVYIGLIAAAVGGIAAAIFAFQSFDMISRLVGG